MQTAAELVTKLQLSWNALVPKERAEAAAPEPLGSAGANASAAAAGAAATSLSSSFWLLEALVAPVRRSFEYHFSGTRKTNSRERPEWFFSFLLATLTDHEPFIERHVQPVVAQAGGARLLEGDALGMDFAKQLVAMARAKLRRDMPHLIAGEAMRRRAAGGGCTGSD